jgi:DNA-binding CsgD family transcriptional regulator
MIIPLVVHIIPPTICTFLAIYLALQGWREKGIINFILLLLALAAYGIVQVVIQAQSDVNKVADLVRWRTAFWGVIIPLSYLAVITLVNEKRRIWRIISIFLSISGIIIVGLLLNGHTIFRDYYLTGWGWVSTLNPGTWFFWIFYAYLIIGTLALMTTLIATRHLTESYRIQKLAFAMAINLTWGALFTVVPYILLSWLKIPTELILGYACVLAMFLIVFAILKYHPGKLFPTSLFSSLSSLLPTDSVFITPEKTTAWINHDRLFLTGFRKSDLVEDGFEKLFVVPEAVSEEMKRITDDPNYSASFETDCYNNNSDVVRLKVNMMGIRNDFGDITAFLLNFAEISEQIKVIECLQKAYNLSNREKEIVALLLEDCTYSRISDRLFISLNTIKTHTRNIYKKIGVANRAELQELQRNRTTVNMVHRS